MSQSATLYRVSQEIFLQLETSKERGKFNLPALSKSYSTFQGSFMGLEFILSKGQKKETADLISEIFNPTKMLGGEQQNSEDISELYESGEIIYYLDSNTISKINGFLSTWSVDKVSAHYDSNELNRNEIYPWQWREGYSPDVAFNAWTIEEGVKELKAIFETANQDHDYLIVFVG